MWLLFLFGQLERIDLMELIRPLSFLLVPVNIRQKQIDLRRMKPKLSLAAFCHPAKFAKRQSVGIDSGDSGELVDNFPRISLWILCSISGLSSSLFAVSIISF